MTEVAPELRKFMEQLKQWCSEERGRQAQLAQEFAVPRQLVNDWITLRKKPGLDKYFALQSFLNKQLRSNHNGDSELTTKERRRR